MKTPRIYPIVQNELYISKYYPDMNAIKKVYGIRHIVSVSSKKPRGSDNHIPLTNTGHGDEQAERFKEASAQVASYLNSGQVPVLVNCQAGRNRSAVVCAQALLLTERFKTFGEAMRYVQKVYPRAKPFPELVKNAKKAK